MKKRTKVQHIVLEVIFIVLYQVENCLKKIYMNLVRKSLLERKNVSFDSKSMKKETGTDYS